MNTTTTHVAPKDPNLEKLWTLRAAADFLGVSERYLRDSDCPRLRLPGGGIKGQPLIRFMPEVVRAWVQQWRTDENGPFYGSAV